jgi:hypothetical protein
MSFTSLKLHGNSCLAVLKTHMVLLTKKNGCPVGVGKTTPEVSTQVRWLRLGQEKVCGEVGREMLRAAL